MITLVVLCGIPLGVLNTLFTDTAMNISPVPRPVASAGYNFVRFLGGAVSPWICGKLGENVVRLPRFGSAPPASPWRRGHAGVRPPLSQGHQPGPLIAE